MMWLITQHDVTDYPTWCDWLPNMVWLITLHDVTDYLQGEQPDEDEVYALIAALKRLYAFSWWVACLKPSNI